MKVVIQCAKSKDPTAGYFRNAVGQKLHFVAKPSEDEVTDPIDTRPDARPMSGLPTWRQQIKDYNECKDENRFGLFPAYLLYKNSIYRKLVKKFGPKKVFVLSAGWGLIRSDFLLPQYNVTFTPGADEKFRRRPNDTFDDFNELSADSTEGVIFFGGKDYLPLFCQLTSSLEVNRRVYYRSIRPPDAPGCQLVRYERKAPTNWHYACAKDFIKGMIN